MLGDYLNPTHASAIGKPLYVIHIQSAIGIRYFLCGLTDQSPLHCGLIEMHGMPSCCEWGSTERAGRSQLGMAPRTEHGHREGRLGAAIGCVTFQLGVHAAGPDCTRRTRDDLIGMVI